MKKILSALAIAVLAVASLAGCAKLEKRITGKFTGELSLDSSKENKPGPPTAPTMMKAMSLELNDDKTFTMHMQEDTEGTWNLDAGVVTLTVQKVDKTKLEDLKKTYPDLVEKYQKPIRLQTSDGGYSLTIIEENSTSPLATVFRKKKPVTEK